MRACERAVESQAAALDALEDAVLAQTARWQLERLVRLRHSVAALHRHVEAEVDVFADGLGLPRLGPGAPLPAQRRRAHTRLESRHAGQQVSTAHWPHLILRQRRSTDEISERSRRDQAFARTDAGPYARRLVRCPRHSLGMMIHRAM